MASGNSEMPPDGNPVTSPDTPLSPDVASFSPARDEPVSSAEDEVEDARSKQVEAQEARQAEEERSRRALQRLGLAAPSRRRQPSPAASSVVSASSQRSVDTTLYDLEEPVPGRPGLPSYDDAIAERPYPGPILTPPAPFRSYETMEATAATELNDQEPVSENMVSQAPTETQTPTETQPLLVGHDTDLNDRRGGRWPARLRHSATVLSRNRRGLLKKLLFCLLLACVIASLVKAILFIDEHRKDRKQKDPKPPTSSPSSDASKRASKFCPSELSTSGWVYTFDGDDGVFFTQLSSSRLSPPPRAGFGSQVRSSGEIQILRAEPKHQDGQKFEHDVVVQVDVYCSSLSIARLLQFESERNDVLLTLPRTYNGHIRGDEVPCLYVVVYIMVAPGSNLTTLGVASEVLNINVDESLDLGAGARALNLTSLVGEVSFPQTLSGASGIRSRNIDVQTMSASIEGAFPLYDTLSISSSTGDINASIDLNDADPYAVKPAQLHLKTLSGNIHAEMPAVNQFTVDHENYAGSSDAKAAVHDHNGTPIPVRDYRTSVDTRAGDVKVQLLHGSRSDISAGAGNVDASLIPYGDQSHESEISITTSAGDVNFRLLDSITDPNASIRHLKTTVKSSVGNLDLRFPATWEGEVQGDTISGSFEVLWGAFHPRKSGKEPGNFPYFHISGYVGDGDSTLEFGSLSGVMHLRGPTNNTSRRGRPPNTVNTR